MKMLVLMCVSTGLRRSTSAEKGYLAGAVPAPDVIVSQIAAKVLCSTNYPGAVYVPDTGPDSVVRSNDGQILGVHRLYDAKGDDERSAINSTVQDLLVDGAEDYEKIRNLQDDDLVIITRKYRQALEAEGQVYAKGSQVWTEIAVNTILAYIDNRTRSTDA